MDANHVLIQVDQMNNSKEFYSPDFWARDDKPLYGTVEHVLPQADKLPDHWVEMIADGDRKKASDLQEALVHHLETSP